MLGLLFLAAAAGLAVLGMRWQRRHDARQGSWIDPQDLIWTAAIGRARATIPAMRELLAEKREVWVKFPSAPGSKASEHVWGTVLDLTPTTAHVHVATQPRGARLGPEVTVQLAELEDWQVELPDGSIRGGFTTRAEIEIARREGRPIPPHIAEMEPRLVDR
jgi:hypothetical protein